MEPGCGNHMEVRRAEAFTYHRRFDRPVQDQRRSGEVCRQSCEGLDRRESIVSQVQPSSLASGDLEMTYKACFQCINGGPGQYSLLEIIYRCPTCGDLLEVRHDLEALKTRAAGAWIKLFD